MSGSSEIRVTPSAVLDAMSKLSQLQDRVDAIDASLSMSQSTGCSANSLHKTAESIQGLTSALSSLIAFDIAQISAGLEGFDLADVLLSDQISELGS